MTFMIISLLLPSLTAVAEAMSSDPLRVCALSPSPRGSVSFTCTNLSVCTQRRRFFAGHEPSIVDVKHTTQPRENNKSKFDRGIIWCAPRTFHGACGEASPSPRNVGNFRLQAKPVSATRTCNNGYKCTRQGRAQQIKSRAGHMVHRQRVGSTERRRGVRRQRVGLRIGRLLGRRIGRGWGIQWNTFHKRVCRIYC